MTGYLDGECDSIWDDGYDDAYDKLKPAYSNDEIYMDGYKHVKEDRKKF